MSAIGGSRTRDIAVDTRAELRAHAAQHAADVADVNRTFAETRADQVRMHAENNSRIDKVEAKVDALPWKIIGAMAAMLTLAATALGYLIVHGPVLFGAH